MTYTGKKGYRVWQFSDSPIPDNVAARFQHQVLTKLGFVQQGSGKYFKDGVEVETLIRSGDGGIVKIPFSRHQTEARKEYYELPVNETTMSDLPNHPPTDDDWLAATMIFEEWERCEAEAIALQVEGEWEQTPNAVAPKKPRVAPPEDYDIPKDSTITFEMYERVMERPCLKYCLENSLHTYWPRATLALSLSAMGYRVEDAAAFFWKHVCDNEDKMNPSELKRQLGYYYPSSGSCMCRVFQNPASPHYCCPGSCGRARPTDVEPPLEIDIPPVTPLLTPAEAEAFFNDIIVKGKNVSILGPARSGKTTGIGLAVIRNGTSAVILVPRISIITDTWLKVLSLAKAQGHTTKACFLPDVRCSCLKLKKRIASIREENKLKEDELSAVEQLPFYTKPNCEKCKYKYSVPAQIEDNTLYGEADPAKGICGYQTVVQNSPLWNIIILTNKKFNRIVSITQDEGFDAPVYRLITSRNAFVLDEVSSYFETPDADIDIFSKVTGGTEYKFVEALRQDVLKVTKYIEHKIEKTPLVDTPRREALGWKQYNFDHNAAEIMKEVEDNYTVVVNDPDRNVYVLKRSVTIDEIDSMKKALHVGQVVAEHRASTDNEALLHIYDLITLGSELEWIFSNDPATGYDVRVSLKIAPKTIGYLNAIMKHDAQIIALDVLPTVIDIDRFFGINFEHINIGDRGHIFDNFAIIPDTQHIRASDLLKERNFNRMISFVEKVIIKFGEENVGLLFPTIRVENAVMARLGPKYPKLDVRHHRGTLTMGVHCSRRVAVSICAPFSPKRSLHWLKIGPYKELLSGVTNNQLWMHQQAKETMQGEARYIDPEAKARSVVFAFGQPSNTVERSYLNAVVKPKILSVNRKGYDDDLIAQGYAWKVNGRIIELPSELVALRLLLMGQQTYDVSRTAKLPLDDVISILRSVK